MGSSELLQWLHMAALLHICTVGMQTWMSRKHRQLKGMRHAADNSPYLTAGYDTLAALSLLLRLGLWGPWEVGMLPLALR